MASGLSDLVLDTQIRVEFHQTAHHRFVFEPATLSARPTKYVRRRETQHVWVKERLLGHGSYGDVYLHRCTTGSADDDEAAFQAVKKIDKARMVTNKINYHKEIEAIAKFSQEKYHGLFVKFLGWYENEVSVFIAMEYIEHGDLSSHLTQPLPEVEARIITFQLAEGLMFLHANSFVHRDVKPKNIFVIQTGPEWHVKLGDFGISKRISDTTNISSFVGTRLFMAPEIQGFLPPEEQDESIAYNFTQSIDMWSLGVTIFFLLFHDYPFSLKQANKLPRYVSGGEFPFPERPSSSSPLSQECYQFIEGVMGRSPRNRLSAKEALEGKWLCHLYVDVVEESTALDKCEPESITGKNLAEEAPGIQNDPIDTGTLKTDVVPTTIQPNSPKSDPNDAQESNLSKNSTPERSKKDMQRDPETIRIANSPDSKLKKPRRHVSFSSSVTFIDRLEHLYRDEAQASDLGKNSAPERSKEDTQRDPETVRIAHPPYSKLDKSQRHVSFSSPATFIDRLEHLYRDEPTGGIDGEQNGNSEEQKNVPTESSSRNTVKTHRNNNMKTKLTMLNDSHCQGAALLDDHKYDQAEKVLVNVFDERKSILGLEHESTLTTCQVLGCVYYKKASFDKAYTMFKMSADGRKKILAKNHPETLRTQYWLGDTALQQGNLSEAESILRETANEQKNVLGSNDPMTLETLQRVGLVFWNQKKWKEAQDVFVFVTDGRKKVLGPTHKSTQKSLAWLGYAAFNSGEYQIAVDPLKEVLADRKNCLGLSDPTTVDTMTLLAECLLKLKRYNEAVPTWKEAILQCKDDKYEGWKLYATHMLGQTLVSLGDFGGAIDAFREAIEGQKKRYGPKHRRTLESAHSLAWAYADIFQYQAAEAIFTVNKENAVESLGLEDTLTLSAAHGLGVLQLKMQQYAPAERNLQLAVTGRTKTCGSAASPTLSSLHAHFQAQYGLKRYHDAERTYHKSLAGEISAYGHPSPKTLDNLTFLAEAYLWHSEIEKAQDLAESLFQERAALNGEMDESTQRAKMLLDEIHRVREQQKEARNLEEETRIRNPEEAQKPQELVHRIRDQKEAQKKPQGLISRVLSLWESTTLKAKTKATTQS